MPLTAAIFTILVQERSVEIVAMENQNQQQQKQMFIHQ